MPEHKTLLILGASADHLDAITAARELGLRVLTADGNPDAPGHSRSDKAFAVHPYDVPAILEICRSQEVGGILAMTSSAAYLPAAWIAQALQLPAIDPEKADMFADKLRFRELVTELCLPHPQTHKLSEGVRLPSEIFDGARWVIRPDRGWASRGVFIITGREQFDQLYPASLSLSPGATGMLERYIQGQQGIAQGFLRDGKVEPLWIIDRTSAAEPYTSVASLRMPTRVPQHQRKQLVTMLEQIFKTMGVTDCIFHADFLAGDGKVYVLGISPTLAGYGIGGLIKRAMGVDLTRLAVELAMGKRADLPPWSEPKAAGLVMLGVEKAGRLEFEASAAESFVEIPWVQGLRWYRTRGTSVKEFSSSDRRVGQFGVVAQDRDQLDARINEALRRLNVHAE